MDSYYEAESTRIQSPKETEAAAMVDPDFLCYPPNTLSMDSSEPHLPLGLLPEFEGNIFRESTNSLEVNQLPGLPDTMMTSEEGLSTAFNIDRYSDGSLGQVAEVSNIPPLAVRSPQSIDNTGMVGSSSRCDRRLSFQDELLLTLRDDRGKKWQEISASFEDLLGKRYRVPTLQMRYIRLQKRLRSCTDEDMSALSQAYAYWAEKKWQIVSEKMKELGRGHHWTPDYCESRWLSYYKPKRCQ